MTEPTNLPATTTPDRELVKEIAMDIGKEAVSHLRVMYPEAFAVLGRSGQTSLRNCIRNEIMAALGTVDAEGIRKRLEDRRRTRRNLHKAWDDIQREEAGRGVRPTEATG